jgi:hypothetical protein
MPAPVPPTIPDRDPGDETPERNLRTISGDPDVVFWRYEELIRHGYSVLSAMALAERHEVDLHTACELLDGGCPQSVAVAILL